MTCSKYEISLSKRVDGEPLSGEETRLLDAHLLSCAACRRALREEEERSRLLRGALGRGREDLAPVARRIVLAAGRAGSGEAGVRRPRTVHFLLAPLAGSLAAAGLAWGLVAVWWSPGPVEAPGGRPVHIVLEESRNDTDLVPAETDRAVGRDTRTSRWIIYDVPAARPRGPAASPADGELFFDGERTDTRYFQPVSWQYR